MVPLFFSLQHTTPAFDIFSLSLHDALPILKDLDVIAETTRFVTGTSHGSGDPSPVTAHGVWHGMRAVAEAAFGEPTLEGRHVVVQGVGKVGSGVARKLKAEGARVTVADIDAAAAGALA